MNLLKFLYKENNMSEYLKLNKVTTFSLADSENDEMIRKINYALSVPERIQIMRYLLNSSKKFRIFRKRLIYLFQAFQDT